MEIALGIVALVGIIASIGLWIWVGQLNDQLLVEATQRAQLTGLYRHQRQRAQQLLVENRQLHQKLDAAGCQRGDTPKG